MMDAPLDDGRCENHNAKLRDEPLSEKSSTRSTKPTTSAAGRQGQFVAFEVV